MSFKNSKIGSFPPIPTRIRKTLGLEGFYAVRQNKSRIVIVPCEIAALQNDSANDLVISDLSASQLLIFDVLRIMFFRQTVRSRCCIDDSVCGDFFPSEFCVYELFPSEL